jgi:hypothetical protein
VKEATVKDQIASMILAAVIDEEFMVKLYDQAMQSPNELDLRARAHSAAVVSLHLADVALEQLRNGGEDETETLAFATLAVVQKELSIALNQLREWTDGQVALIGPCIGKIIKDSAAIEAVCGDQVGRIMSLGDETEAEQRAAFVEILAAAQAALPQAQEIVKLTKSVQAMPIVATGRAN